MQINLLTFNQDAQLATNPFKAYMRRGKASKLPFSWNLTLRMTFWPWLWRTIILKTSSINSDTLKTLLQTLKLLKSDHEIPRYVTFALQLAAILDLAEKRVKGVKNIEPYDFRVIWSLMMQYQPLAQFGQTNLAKLHLSPHYNWKQGLLDRQHIRRKLLCYAVYVNVDSPDVLRCNKLHWYNAYVEEG